MNIVTQYLEANCITLPESDTQKLYDIVKLQLIIPGEDVTANTVLKKFFTDCDPSDNTKNIEKPVKCFVFHYSLLSRPYMQKYQIRKTVKCKKTYQRALEEFAKSIYPSMDHWYIFTIGG